MDERRDEYGFCPKCGAVTHNGVCQSCGHGRRMGVPEKDVGEFRQNVPKKKKLSGGSKIVIFLAVVLGILLIVFAVLTIRAVLGQSSRSSGLYIDDGFFGGYYDDYDDSDDYYSDWYDDYDDYDDWDEGYEEYVPSPDDEFYKEIADATVKGLSYEIEWRGFTAYPDDDDSMQFYSATIPYVLSEDEGLMRQVNEEIWAEMGKYRDSYRDYTSSSYSIGYVTYMDEDTLSVVVRHDLENADYSSHFELGAVTFDMNSGRIIPYDELVQVDMEMVKKFRSQDSLQNGTVGFVDGLSDEELLEYLQDDEKRVVFRTPVGMELGFNYDGGWVTVTLKDQAL